MTTREAVGLTLGGALLGALAVIAVLDRHDAATPAATPAQTAVASPAKPVLEWKVLEDVSFEMQPGERRSVELKNVSTAGAHVEATSGVNLTLVSPQNTCEFAAVTSAREACEFPDHWGTVYVADARTQKTVATNGLAALFTRSSKMAETAIAANRVHLIVSAYTCTANCPR